jgi:hypothetical protein
MLKTIVTLSLLASVAEAEPFVEVGQSYWNKPPLSLWHQEDVYPASFNLHDSYMRLGVEVGYLRAFWFDLGDYTIDSLNTFDADYFSGKCPSKCRPPRRFETSGSLDGLGFTGNYRIGPVRLEAGVTYNRQTFKLVRHASPLQGGREFQEERLALGYMYGISFETGHWSLSGYVYEPRSASWFDGGEKPSGVDPVRAVAIGYRF